MVQVGQPGVVVPQLLGQCLIAEGVITKEQLERGLREAGAAGELLGQTLVRLGWATANQILFALARQAGIDIVDLENTPIDDELVRGFPESFLRGQRIIPLRRDGYTLTAATSDLANLTGVDELRRLSNLFVTLVAAREDQIFQQLDRVFGRKIETPIIVPLADKITTGEIGRSIPPEAEADQRPAVTVVDDLLRKAVLEGASDVHIEPTETSLATRFRFDGLLRPGPTLPRALYSSVLTRIKILADLNIAENRLPQDGRILHQVDGRRLDLRVSMFPTIHGEAIAIRVLDKSRSFGLESLGMSAEELAAFRRCITRPHGLFLVTGPTGSGKTTTLYSALHEINSVEKNIVTLEDPVEYELPGVRQTQVNIRAGLTFAAGLRALLRQDPDVMLVGEVRDAETVEIAIRAAMTGHLVFSTLHTNDAIGAIPRLLDMGVPAYLLSSSLIGVLAQRLVRIICPQCKVRVPLAQSGLERLGDAAARVTATFSGTGCTSCRGSGYKGRCGVFELFVPELVREAGFDAEQLKRTAIEKRAMVPMLDQALAKVNAGVTTVDEVVRAVFSEAT